MRARARVVAAAVATSLVAAAGFVSVGPAAAVGNASAALVGARPNATRLDFAVGDRVDASVDVGTGNLLVLTTDLTLPGIGKDLQLGLDYNSLLVKSSSPAAIGSAGAGWAMRIGSDTKLVANDDGSVLSLAPGGRQGLYRPTSAGASTYTTPAGFDNSLVKTGSGWQLTDHATNDVSSFDTTGRLTAITDRNNQATTFTYASGVLSTVTSTRGGSGARTATVAFTAGGLLRKLTQVGDAGTTRSVSYTVDSYGSDVPLLTSITDVLGRTTGFGYDANDRLASIINTAGVETTFAYDAVNRVIQVTRVNPGGADAVTRLVYSSSSQTLVAGPTTDPAVPVGAGPHTSYTLNGSGLVTTTSDPLGRTRAATYTPNQDVATSTSGSGAQTMFGYAANNGESLTSVTSPTGASVTAAYANTGAARYLPSGVTDSQGNTSAYRYDAAGNQTQTTNTGAATTATVGYYSDGVLASSVDPRGNTTTYTENPTTHQVTKITPPSGSNLGVTSLTWDQFGRLATLTDGRGVVRTYGYDLADRVTSVSYSDGTPTVGYSYDTAGNVATRTQTGATVSYGYDAFDRLVSRTAASGGGSITNTYDLAGNLTATTDEGGTTSYTYDAADQVVSQTTSGGQRVDYGYNSDGNRTDTWFATNPNRSSFAAHTHTDYDPAGRVVRTWTSRGSDDATRVVDVSYCYSPYLSGQACPTTSTGSDTGKIAWSVNNLTGARSTYSYGASNRLRSATNDNGHDYTYRYDPAGNRTRTTVDGTTTQTLTFNTVNQIASPGYGYDAAGNRTQDPSGTTLGYDAADRMTRADSTAGTVTYTYAGTDQSELVKVVTATGSSYVYTYGRTDQNGQPLLESFTKNGNQYSIDYDPQGTPIALNLPSGTQHFFALDGQGTVAALIKNDGTQTGAYTYDPYGTVLTATGPGDAVGANVYRHTLGLIDDYTGGTGWTKHGTRWNDTTTGTWTTQDPLSILLDPQTGNRYLYAAGDPLNNTDPSGQSLCSYLPTVAAVAGSASLALGAVALFATGTIAGAPAGAVLGAASVAIGAGGIVVGLEYVVFC